MNKTFMDAIEQCENVRTKAAKLEALKGIQKHHQRLVHEALNKHRRFNVKSWDTPKYSSKDYPIFIDFYALLDRLVARELTGNAARRAVTAELSKYTKRTAKYLTRVLKKDLDCGAEKTTFLKVYPEMNLPDFQVMLARKLDEKKGDLETLSFPRIAEVKYDGYRIVAVSEDHEVHYYTREGRTADFCNGLFDDELRKMEDYLGQPIVVDGEVLGADFQDVGEARGKKGADNKKRLRLYAFDMMTMAEWTNRSCKKAQTVRSSELATIIKTEKLNMIIKSDYRIVYDVKEARKYFKEVVKHGGKGKDEGLILKKPEALYEWTKKRSGAWVKWKPHYSFDLTIKGFKPGKGKFHGTLGSLICEGEDENGRKIEADAAGMTDAMRDWFWFHQKEALGLTVEIEADKMTKAKNSDVWSLRFGQFKRIRDDK